MPTSDEVEKLREIIARQDAIELVSQLSHSSNRRMTLLSCPNDEEILHDIPNHCEDTTQNNHIKCKYVKKDQMGKHIHRCNQEELSSISLFRLLHQSNKRRVYLCPTSFSLSVPHLAAALELVPPPSQQSHHINSELF